MTTVPTQDAAAGPAGPASRVAVIGPHILDVLGRPVDAIPAGQGSARLTEIRATAAGTAAGTGVDLAKLGARVSSFGAVGTDLLADVLLAALASYGIDTGGLVRKTDGPDVRDHPADPAQRRAARPARAGRHEATAAL